MLLTGRPRARTPKLMASDLASLDLFKFHKAGGLVPGAVTRVRWPYPTAPLDITVRAESDRIMLSIDGAGEVPVRVEREAVYFGGLRPWLVCSICLARRRSLYIKDGCVGCRQCFGLCYRSRCEFWLSSPALRRAVKLRRRLGADVQPFAPLPPRPRYRTARNWYDNIVAEIHAHEAEALGMLANINSALAERKGR
jgi:hypothetical protein